MVVAPDRAEAVRRFWAREGLAVPAVADAALLVTLGQPRRWWPGRLPALLAVAPGGAVVWRHLGRSMSDLPDWDRAVEALRPWLR